MSRSRAVRSIAALVALSCVTLAACSSSSSPKPPSRATLRTVVLKQSDVPAGYRSKPTDNSDGNTDLIQQISGCVGVHGIKQSDRLHEVSSDFGKGNIEISSDATSFKTQSAVDKRIDVLESPKTNTCLNAAFTKQIATALPTGAKAAKTKITVTKGSGNGPSDVIATLKGGTTVVAQGQSAPVYIAATFVRNGLLTGSVTYTSLGKPIDGALRQKLDTTVANRVSKA